MNWNEIAQALAGGGVQTPGRNVVFGGPVFPQPVTPVSPNEGVSQGGIAPESGGLLDVNFGVPGGVTAEPTAPFTGVPPPEMLPLPANDMQTPVPAEWSNTGAILGGTLLGLPGALIGGAAGLLGNNGGLDPYPAIDSAAQGNLATGATSIAAQNGAVAAGTAPPTVGATSTNQVGLLDAVTQAGISNFTSDPTYGNYYAIGDLGSLGGFDPMASGMAFEGGGVYSGIEASPHMVSGATMIGNIGRRYPNLD